jgi:hypothetical protein
MGKQVPNTISDKQMADLQRRAQKANPEMFSRDQVRKRLASQEQQKKAGQS